jgi:aryl-alcohol dehydrogenase-like predicted oxidoreductase
MIEKLVLGTVQLGLDYGINNQLGKPSREKSFEILNKAFDKGVSILDTAEAYGNSQEIIGQFLKENPQKPFHIITKLSANSNVKPKHFLNHIEKNCSVLNVNKLYGYMFHNYQSFKSKLNLYDKLIFARDIKLITKAGISLYTNDEIEDVLANYKEFDFIQIPFNLFDNSIKRKALLDKAKAQNIEVHSRSVFLQGLFFKNSKALSQKLKALVPYLEVLNGIKSKFNLNTLTLSLQYVLQKDYIDQVLIGVDTPEQLNNNVDSCLKNVNIPHELIDAINVKENELLNPSNWY